MTLNRKLDRPCDWGCNPLRLCLWHRFLPLEQKLANPSQGKQSNSEFYTAIKAIWDKLDDVDPTLQCKCNQCTCDLSLKVQKKTQERRLLQSIMKLNDQYSVVRGHILLMSPTPTAVQAYRMITQEENHKEISSSHPDSMVFLADKRNSYVNNYRNQFSGTGQSSGFNAGNPNNQNFGNKKSKAGSNYHCTHCKVPGHSVDRCFKIRDVLQVFKLKTEKLQLLSLLLGKLMTPPMS